MTEIYLNLTTCSLQTYGAVARCLSKDPLLKSHPASSSWVTIRQVNHCAGLILSPSRHNFLVAMGFYWYILLQIVMAYCNPSDAGTWGPFSGRRAQKCPIAATFAAQVRHATCKAASPAVPKAKRWRPAMRRSYSLPLGLEISKGTSQTNKQTNKQTDNQPTKRTNKQTNDTKKRTTRQERRYTH